MEYAITGGCGFIGSHLADRLIEAGHRVTIIDDFSTGKRQNAPKGATIIEGDVTTPGIYDALVPKIDGWFHLAAVVSVQMSAQAWLRTHQVNLGGMVALFDALARHQRKVPVVFASSAAVYGDCAEMPLSETARCAPLSAYGADKFACELHAAVASSIHGIPTVGLRFFNVYGPRQDPLSPYSGVISIFAGRMKQHQPVTIYGDGDQSRDFIYVGDIVGGLFAAMQQLERKVLLHGVFNLCTGIRTSVSALAGMIATLTDTRSAITHAPARAGDIRLSVGNAASAQQALEWRAVVPLAEGLRETLQAL